MPEYDADLSGVKVGDVLIVEDFYRAGPSEVTVTKVGRKLLTVEDHGRVKQFRIDTGIINDSYGHEWLLTREQLRDRELRNELMKQLEKMGISTNSYKKISTKKLQAIRDLLESEDD